MTETPEAFKERCRQEITEGLSAITTKRQMFRDRLKLYVDNNKSEDKVSSNTIYSTIQVAIAIAISDDVTAQFVPKGMGDEEYAENLNSVAENDNRNPELGYDQVNFQSEWDKNFFGVSLRAFDHWDPETLAPRFRVMDPLTWIPQPHTDFYNKSRSEWFEARVHSSEMTEENGWEPDAVEKCRGKIANSETSDSFRRDASLIQAAPDAGWMDVYYGFTFVDGKVCQVVLSSEYEIVKKADLSYFKRLPVARKYFSPLRGDPFGVSLVDLIQDKQRANSTLMNLRVINARFNTLGQTNLFDPRIVKNADALRSPSVNPKWIPGDTNFGPLSNAVYPVPRQVISSDSWNVSTEIARQMQLDTGFEPRTLGVSGDKVITLGESQQIQANANIRFALGFEIGAWGDKEFWSIWYEAYKKNLSSAAKKLIRITSGFGIRAMELTRNDFILGRDPLVYVESKKNVEAMREKERTALTNHLPFILQDPSISLFAKRFMLKKSLKLSGLPVEDANVLGRTYEEEDAISKLPLLDHDDPAGAVIDDMEVDHSVYIAIFQRALDTNAKFAAIEARKMAILATKQFKQQANPTTQSAANAASAQLQSAAMNDSKSGPTSLADIAQ